MPEWFTIPLLITVLIAFNALYVLSEFACNVYERLWEAGQQIGISNAGYRAIGSLHLEKGYADWASELTPEYSPFDAGLGFCVALDKDDFIGREALASIKDKGPKWKLCTFTIDTDKPIMVQGGAPIVLNREVIGGTTSTGYGHTVGMTICFGYIPPRYASRENRFEIEMYKEVYPARLEPRRALYDPERKRIIM